MYKITDHLENSKLEIKTINLLYWYYLNIDLSAALKLLTLGVQMPWGQ